MRRSKIVELLLISLIAVMSFLYFYKIILSPDILVHGDYKYALTVDQHIQYHLNNIFVHAPKLPVLIILYPLKFLFWDVLAEKLFTVSILFLSALLIYFSNKHFIQRSISTNNEVWICLSAFMGTLIFLYNPWTENKIHHHYWLVLALAASYTLISRVDKMVQGKVKSYLIETLTIAFLLVLLSTQVQALLLYLGFLLIIYLIFFAAAEREVLLKKLLRRKMLLVVIGVLLINLFWILPQTVAMTHGVATAGYGMVVENVDSLSRRATILNVLRAASGWVWGPPATPSYTINIFGTNIWNLVSFLPFLVACIPLFLGHKLSKSRDFKKYLLYFGMILTLSILISTGSYYPISGDVYRSAFLYVPLGWVIRDPYKNVGLMVISLSFLFSVLTAAVMTKVKIRRGVKFAFLLFIAISPLIWGWPALTGDLNGHLNFGLSEYPKDLETVINFLNSLSDIKSCNILWYPDEPAYFIYSDVPKLSSKTLNLIDLASRPSLITYMEWALKNNDKKYVNAFLTTLGIKYVILRHDLLESGEKERLSQCVQKFEESYASQKIFEAGNYSVYEIQGVNQRIDIMAGVTYSTTGDSTTNFNFNNTLYTIYFEDFIFASNDKIKPLIDPAYLIPLRSIHHNPDRYWSAATMDGGWLNSFLPYLKKYNIQNWQSDYDKGLVFTRAVPNLKDNPTPNNNDLISYWVFDSLNDLNQWKNYTRENQFGAIYTITLDNKNLKAELWNSTWGWKTINSPLIEAEYGNWYRWELQIKAENAHGVHVKIAEYNDEMKVIISKKIKDIGSGIFDWQTVTIDFTPESPQTKYIQLQIWHGHETTKPLPNKIWIDNVKVYELKRFAEPVTLEIPFTLQEANEYILLTRIFQNQQGGKIQIQLDNIKYTINTKDQLNKFTWQQIDTLTLQRGQHKITLINLEGFNAVNLLALIPKQEYQNAQNQVEQLLQDKRIIYILEAESDLYHLNSVASNKYGGEASNGIVLELDRTSKVWNEIEILKPGNYTFAIRSRGSLTIKIDEKEYGISSPQLDWTYIGSINLEKGIHIIEITNPIQPYTQWNFENGTLENWQANAPRMQTLTVDNYAYEGKYSLKAELNASAWGWKTINSPLIPITPETPYQFELCVAGENSHGVHAKILEYDANKTYLSGKYMIGIGSGNFTWKNIKFEYKPSQNASYIQLQIWHGHETTKPLPNKIWIDNVKVYDLKAYQPLDLDVVWLFSIQNDNETLENIFTANENPAEVINYQKIDPTKYLVKVNATEPFMLSFAESYDPLWVAFVNGERIQSTPLYGAINGFWINQTGLLEITIEYEPQKWFYIGSIISATTLIACTTYLTYDWAKESHPRTNKEKLKPNSPSIKAA